MWKSRRCRIPAADSRLPLAAFSDSLDLCKFSAFAQGADEYAQQYAAALGIEVH